MTLRVPRPSSVGDHAAENLVFIRQAMERSATFTSIPGAGGVAMGMVALVASALAAAQPTGDMWLAVWLGAAAIAAIVAEGQARRRHADRIDGAALRAWHGGAVRRRRRDYV